MKLADINLELLLDKKGYITIDDIELPNGDKFIVKATYCCFPNYLDIDISIGVLSNKYSTDNILCKYVKLISIDGKYHKAPIVVGNMYLDYAKNYLQSRGCEIYESVKNNSEVLATLSSRVMLILSKFHGTVVDKNAYFFNPEKDTKLAKLYTCDELLYLYRPKGRPSRRMVISACNQYLHKLNNKV